MTAQMLKELFAVPLSTIPGHDPAIPPVRTRDDVPQPRVLEAAAVCVRGGDHRVYWRPPPHAGTRGPLRP